MTDNILVLDYGTPESLETIKVAEGAARRGARRAGAEPPPRAPAARVPARAAHDHRRNATPRSIFDEVVTGFRVHPGGAQALFGVRADIATYGKVLGGGLPIGVVAGSAKYMDALDGGSWRYGDDSVPEVGVTFFAGTFVRHPLALAAARAVLLRLKQEGPELQRGLNLRTTAFVERLKKVIAELGAPVQINHFASWFCVDFPHDLPLAALFFALMREKGVHIWEGRAGFLTLAHTDADLDRVVTAFRETLAEMQAADFLPKCAEVPGKDLQVAEARFRADRAAARDLRRDTDGRRGELLLQPVLRAELHGPLSVESLHSALAEVVQRHEALRLSIDLTDERKHAAPTSTVALPLTDLSALDEREREAAIARMSIARLARRSISAPRRCGVQESSAKRPTAIDSCSLRITSSLTAGRRR